MQLDAVDNLPLVLLVDDREDKLAAMRAVLESLPLVLIGVTSGKEALRQLLLHEVAVILLDVNMPVMDGFETAALIRQRPATEHTPIIFVTGMDGADNHVSRGYSLGAVDYIFTPVIPEVLRAKVSAFIDLYRRNRDIRRRSESMRNEAERRAADLSARFGALLNRLDVGVFRRALDGRLLDANPAFYRIFGLDPAVEQTAADLASLGLDIVRDIQLLEAGGTMQEARRRARRGDGREIWISLSKTFAVTETGNRCLDGLVEDVTQRQEAETVLVEKAEELARSNAELEQFAYVASHDLQEPLRMVSAFASLLVRRHATNLNEHGQHVLGQVVEGAARMQAMVHDILAYSRLGLHAELVDVECARVVEQALSGLKNEIERTDAVVTVGELPKLRGDPVLLLQIFANMIGNSLKFHRAGVAPRVSVDASLQGDTWWFAIADNGLGIEPQHIERIFEIFQRLHPRDEYGGTGMGLAVCRKAVQRHGGEILVDSIIGEGSVFRFSIPATAAWKGESARLRISEPT